MTKFLLHVLAACSFVLGLGGAGKALAADDSPGRAADKACIKCHDETWDKPILAIYQTRHGVTGDSRTPGCRNCHGASEAHLQSRLTPPDMRFTKGTAASAEERNEVCLGCHKGDKRTHWSGSQHEARGVACVSCHKIHAANDPVRVRATQTQVCFTCHKSEAAQIHRVSTHPIAAGKVLCSDCHNPHGSAGPKLVQENTVNETCYTCHAEKRGPFLWEHPPATDDCTNCHTPHGSTNPALLKARSPWLCQRCHGDAAPHPGAIYSGANLPGGTVNSINQPTTGATSHTNPLTGRRIAQTNPASQLALRGCSNCHSQIHGSNHPAGMWFAR